MINEVALVLLLGMFGWKIALLYVITGLIIAILSGIIIGRLKPENLIEDFVFKQKISAHFEETKISVSKRAYFASEYTLGIIKKVWPYLLVGIGLGALIHGYVPASALTAIIGSSHWYSVPVAVIIGIPLYSNAAGIIPLVSVLLEKGVSVGTALAFMMSVTALSLPEFIILKKVMKTQLILIFAGIVATGIIATGYIFNIILS
jgi:hypothetical protein